MTTVGDVMTRCPVSVRVDTPFEAVAALLAHRRISAVPVVDHSGAPVGVVSEADLIGAGPGHAAGELMSSPVTTITEDVPLPTAARRLADVRRVFVVADGRLVGVLARRDLLRTYLCPDDVLRARVEAAVAPLVRSDEFVNVSVENGVVLLLGRVQWRGEVGPIGTAAGDVPGVVEVRNRLGYFWDEGAAPARRRFARHTH